MSSARKRKVMLSKLNAYFVRQGGINGEREYGADHTAPYRLVSIEKFLGGWNRMVNYLGFYYPQWKKSPVVEAPVKEPVKAPKAKLAALAKKNEDAE